MNNGDENLYHGFASREEYQRAKEAEIHRALAGNTAILGYDLSSIEVAITENVLTGEVVTIDSIKAAIDYLNREPEPLQPMEYPLKQRIPVSIAEGFEHLIYDKHIGPPGPSKHGQKGGTEQRLAKRRAANKAARKQRRK